MSKPITKTSADDQSPQLLPGRLHFWRFTRTERGDEPGEYTIEAEALLEPRRLDLPPARDLERGVWLGREGGLPLDGNEVSGKHAFLFQIGQTVCLEDHIRREGIIGSKNGTFLDGSRVHGAVELRAGAVIRVGEWLGVFTRGDREPPVPVRVGRAITAACARGVARRVHLTRDVCERLSLARWSNVERQIGDAVESALIKARGGSLRAEHFPRAYLDPEPESCPIAIESTSGRHLAVRFQERVSQVKKTLGWEYLEVLVANPGREYTADDLQREIRARRTDPPESGPVEPGSLVDRPPREPRVDAASTRAVLGEVRKLEQKRIEAEERRDAARVREIDAKLAPLKRYLAQSRPPGNSDASSVAHALQTAYDNLRVHDEGAVKYLKSTIKRQGSAWTYHPESRAPGPGAPGRRPDSSG
jgi:hypothetical protein